MTRGERLYRLPVLVLGIAIALVACEQAVPERTFHFVLSPSPSAIPSASASRGPVTVTLKEFAVPRGQGPHDVWPATDGGVWYTAQLSGQLGWLDPASGATKMVALGPGSAPHGVIVGPDGAPWITDGGQNAIVRVDPKTREVKRFPLPAGSPRADLNTATFAPDGKLWFTGQAGVVGRLDPASGEVRVFSAPRGAGPYGITTTPAGDVAYVSLAGGYLGYVDREGVRTLSTFDPPTKNAGPRRVWSDAQGTLWVSEWNAGQLARWDAPGAGRWKEYQAPGPNPMVYAVYVDETGAVWATQWGANALVRFDPASETFASYPFPSASANVRQLAGRKGEVWGAESGADKLVVATFR